MTKRITTFITDDGMKYQIVLHQNMYCGVKEEFINADGTTNKNLNGFELNASETLEGCINGIKRDCKFRKLKSDGINEKVALLMAYCDMDKEKAESQAKMI